MPLRYTGQRYSNYKSHNGGPKKAGFSFKGFSFKAIKEQFVWLFTTKEGLKKVGTAALITLGFIIFLFGWFAKDLPTPNKINSSLSAQTTQIFDRNGKLLYEMHGDKNRILVEFNDIPQYVKDATVAVEDKNFYKHGGFSATRILGAAFVNLITGSKSQGASTITQQFVKNALLSPEKTYTRKIKEIILSMEIEQMYKKDDILKMYLNEIPYGSNAYGVKVAAKTYFDKELKDLTLEEAAVLAALPQAPTYYSPFGDNKDALMARKNVVLSLMADQGYITKSQADAAKKKVITFSNNPYGSITAPHFVMYVKQQLVDKYGEKMANEGGLKVYTTLDLEKQQLAEKAVEKWGTFNAKKYRATNASLVSIDPKTGQILAMVGSRDFFNVAIDGNVNVNNMARQPGSSFKPFAYATAWQQKSWGPGSTLYDFKTDFGGGYIPKNYDGKDHGVQSMRTALDGSLNIPAVKTLYIAGMNETLKTAKDLGITTLTNTQDYGLSLVLGAGEVKPIEMAGAYGTFANGGVRQENSWFVKITDSKNKVLEEYKKKDGQKVLDPQVAYLMNNVLSDNQARSFIFGSHNYLTLSGRPVAAKTGTTNDNKDAWTAGYTPQLATVVWVGNNDGTKMAGTAGGSMAAAPIWNEYMKGATKGMPVEQFKRPAGIKTVTLDAITGRAVTAATTKTRTDVFPSWYQVPGAENDPNIARVDKLSNKLATEFCPSELIEIRGSTGVRAEIPQNDPAFSRWNAPIQAWAAKNGLAGSAGAIPTDKCNLHTGQNLPEIVNLIPGDGDSVTKTFEVWSQVKTPSEYMSYSINVGGNNYVMIPTGDHYETTITLPAGTYTLTATLKDKLYQQDKRTIQITVN